MHDFVSKKIPNGKLLKLRVDFGKKINSITISGDFFIHPEEGIDLIEEALKGTPVTFDTEEFIQLINAVVKENNLELIGFSVRDLAEFVKEVVSK
ncbi:MAG TPA: hypothetical protein VJK05_04815 [archaeon]|nr:hypothetical protein [archaeon]